MVSYRCRKTSCPHGWGKLTRNLPPLYTVVDWEKKFSNRGGKLRVCFINFIHLVRRPHPGVWHFQFSRNLEPKSDHFLTFISWCRKLTSRDRRTADSSLLEFIRSFEPLVDSRIILYNKGICPCAAEILYKKHFRRLKISHEGASRQVTLESDEQVILDITSRRISGDEYG